MDNREGQPIQESPPTMPAPPHEHEPSSPTTHPEAVPPAPMPETIERAERNPLLEKNAEKAREMVTSTVARFSAATVDKRFLKPGERAQDDAEAERIGHEAAAQPPEKISSSALENYSLKARAETTYSSQAEWRADVAKWIKKVTVDKPQNPERVKAALASLGIDATKHGDELDNQLKEFSKTYLKKDKSEIKRFAEDLAKGCQDRDDNIDLTQFDQQLQSISELMNSFGTKDDINLRVKDYAVDYALHHQAQRDENVKNAIAQKVTEHIKKPLGGRDHDSFIKIYAEEQKANDLKEKVRVKLQEAEENPDKTPTAGAAHGEESALQYRFAKGEITKKEFDQKRDEIKAKWKGVASFDTPAELMEALRQLKDKGVYTDESMMETYQHEKAHYDVARKYAEEYGLPEPFFNMQITRDKDRNSYHPSTEFYSLDDPEEAKRMQEEILLAPGLKYLSEHDLAALGITKEDREAALALEQTPEGQSKIQLFWKSKQLEQPDISKEHILLGLARMHHNPTSIEELQAEGSQ